MVTGHTRCLVDGMFGLVKRKFWRSDSHTLSQLADVVNSSAEPNVAQCLPGSNINWHEWDTFFVNFFRPVPGVSQYHHFEFSATDPGLVKINCWR